ncbi:putative Cytochrome P450 [Seiridium unicorne]|uniref:Cytochrome P450 n=1 Tax=Seiridium unicorne TaxID=138068 RepID=A0ABR2VFQ9_9PEZI
MSFVVGNIQRPIIYGTLLFAFWVITTLSSKKRLLPLPPEPKDLPIVKNIRGLPPPGVPEWEHWAKHKNLYDPISSVTALGATIVLIHGNGIALDLLQERSSRYS